MIRTPFRFPFLLLLFSFAGLLPAAEKPNVLMIAIDDLRPFLGCYGDERAQSPHIDALASRSVLFERAYCNYAKCGASRLSLMTGLRPGSIRVYGHGDRDVAAFRERRPDAVSVARWFRDHGYETRSFGKIDHDGWQIPSDWSVPPSPGRDGEMLEVIDPENPTAPTFIAERTACPVRQSPDVPDDHFFAGRMTDEVSGLLADRETEEPFFFAVGFRRPHLPFVAPKRYYDLHQPDESWLAPNPPPPAGVPPLAWFNSDGYTGMARRLGEPMPDPLDREAAMAFNGFELRSYVGAPVRGEMTTATQLELLHAYAACVSYVDAQVGRILAVLEESGLAENTIVLLWSDHGWHLGEASAWGKMTNYEIANRVPLLVSGPGVEPGRTRALAGLVDLYPTLCDLAGLPRPDHLEGRTLRPVLEDPASGGQEAVFHEYARYRGRFLGRAVRTDRFRLVEWVDREGNPEFTELYDLEADPLETRNLAEESPKRVEMLSRLLDASPGDASPGDASPEKP